MDNFEKELEKEIDFLGEHDKKTYGDVVIVLKKFLTLYRSEKIHSDRLASALEEVAKTEIFMDVMNSSFDTEDVGEICTLVEQAASAIRSKEGKQDGNL